MKKIAFFGATGMLGKPVLQELVKSGYHVKALCRNLSRAQAFFPEGVEWIQGDLADHDRIELVLKDADTVYMNLSVDPASKEGDFQPEREGLSAILSVAKWNDVSHVLFLSSLVQFYQGTNGFQWWVFDVKRHALEKIKRSGLPYTIFYPSTFMENYTDGGFVMNQKALTIGKSKYPNWLIAAEDYAAMVKNAIERFDGEQEKEYVIQGPEGFTLDKAADIFASSSGGRYKKMYLPLSLLKAMGLVNRKYDYVAHIMEAINNYPEKFSSEEAWSELGKPRITFKEFIARRLEDDRGKKE